MMSDVVTLKDGLDPDGMYYVHLMGNEPIEREVPAEAKLFRGQEAGTYVFRAAWPYRGPCEIVCEDYDWRRVVVLWALFAGDRISEQALEAAQMYYDIFLQWPATAWLERMPKGIEPGTIIRLPFEAVDLENEMVVVDSDFVPNGFLAVGCSGIQPEAIGI